MSKNFFNTNPPKNKYKFWLHLFILHLDLIYIENDSSTEEVFCSFNRMTKRMILLRKLGIFKENFWIFYDYFLRKFLDFIVSSIEALFYKGWEVFWMYFWWFLTMLKWRKTLIFQGFVELGIEVVVCVKCLGNAYFISGLWMEQMCRSWQSNACSKM